MNMAISMTADLLRALSPAVPQRLWTCAYSPGTESERYFREATEKAMRECDIDWCALARIRRRENMANLCQLSFQKKLSPAFSALSWLSDGRYPGDLANFAD